MMKVINKDPLWKNLRIHRWNRHLFIVSVKSQWKGLKSILDVKDVNLYYGYVQGS